MEQMKPPVRYPEKPVLMDFVGAEHWIHAMEERVDLIAILSVVDVAVLRICRRV